MGLIPLESCPVNLNLLLKKIGHGITCNADLDINEEVWKVILLRFM